MNDLRKAAEMALKRLDMYFVEHGNDDDFAALQALRQALAQSEEKMRIEGNGKLTTKPYPDGYDSEQQFRQSLNDKPAVKSYCGGKPNYCTPEVTPEVTPYVDAVNMSQDRVDETAKSEHEPVAWFIQYEDSHEFVWSKPDGWRAKQALEIQPLYTAPPVSDYHEGWEEGFKAAKKEWVGLTHEERFLNDCRSPEEIEYAIAIEAKLKEKNSG